MSLQQYVGPEYSIWSLISDRTLTDQQRDYYSAKHFDALRVNAREDQRLAALSSLAASGEVAVIGDPVEVAAYYVTQPA